MVISCSTVTHGQGIICGHCGYSICIDSAFDSIRVHGQSIFINNNSAVFFRYDFKSISACIQAAVCICSLYSNCSIGNINCTSCRIKPGKIDFCRFAVRICNGQFLIGQCCRFDIRMSIGINGTLNSSCIYGQSVFVDGNPAVFFGFYGNSISRDFDAAIFFCFCGNCAGIADGDAIACGVFTPLQCLVNGIACDKAGVAVFDGTVSCYGDRICFLSGSAVHS